MGNENNNAKDTEIQSHETSSFIDSNNTAHPSDEHHQAVTSNNPTSESIQQPSYQQLHEAMLAAVNSHGVGSLSPHGLVAAAAAAMAAAAAGAPSSTSNASSISPTANVSITQSETTTPQPPPQPQVHHSKHKPLHELDVTKRESIRAANRERKKKWRIHNEERNKDNDLRCRVNKRATKLYGAADTPEKKAWAQEEFEKRRQKRMEKERRKNAIDNVLSVPGSPHLEKPQDMPSLSADSVLNGVSDQLGYYNMQQQQQQQQQAAPLVDPAAAAKMLDFPPELQRQLLEQLNNMIAMTNNGGKLPSSSTSNDDSSSQQQPQDEDQVAPNNQESTHEEQGLSSSTSASNSAHNSPLQDKNEEEESKEGGQQQQQQDDKKPEYPMDAVLTLMQLNAGWRE